MDGVDFFNLKDRLILFLRISRNQSVQYFSSEVHTNVDKEGTSSGVKISRIILCYVSNTNLITCFCIEIVILYTAAKLESHVTMLEVVVGTLVDIKILDLSLTSNTV